MCRPKRKVSVGSGKNVSNGSVCVVCGGSVLHVFVGLAITV